MKSDHSDLMYYEITERQTETDNTFSFCFGIQHQYKKHIEKITEIIGLPIMAVVQNYMD